MFARKRILVFYSVLFFAFLGAHTSVSADSTSVELPVIYFSSNSATVEESEFAKLDRVVLTLANYPKMKLLVLGHTDSQGSASSNQALSARRAASVVNYLISHGIGSERLNSHALSESRPMAANANANGRAENRRVVFIKQ